MLSDKRRDIENHIPYWLSTFFIVQGYLLYVLEYSSISKGWNLVEDGFLEDRWLYQAEMSSVGFTDSSRRLA